MPVEDRRRLRFAGPLLPGPDWDEPLERFRDDVLERDCGRSPRVRDYLNGRRALEPDNLLEALRELQDLRETVSGLQANVNNLTARLVEVESRLADHEEDERALRRDLDRAAGRGPCRTVPLGDAYA